MVPGPHPSRGCSVANLPRGGDTAQRTRQDRAERGARNRTFNPRRRRMMSKRHPLLDGLETERFVLQPLGRIDAFRIGYYNWNGDAEIMRNLIHSAVPLKPWRWFRRMVWA